MGSIAFSDVILLKNLSLKHEARKVTEMVETVSLTDMFRQRYQLVGNRAIHKINILETTYVQALRWQVTVD